MDASGAGRGQDRVETIFHRAAELGSADSSVYLDRACADEPGLRARVQRLLDAGERAGNFMRDTDGPTPDGDAAGREAPGDRIGPYKLLQVIGEGGMGTVYMAEQVEPVERRVALKIVKPGMDTGEIVARFEAERQALALMDHPCIAKVLDAGETKAGRPYFAMELVKGIPITEYCDGQGLKPRRRLELFVNVCRAVHHAHQKGVIHRDLKPANVLVANYDDKAVPKVIDFGVAKATGQKLTERTMFTQFGQIIGTFEYMSPEQAKLNQLDVDTRADIYSLGVLLYELLTGTTPFERGRLQLVGFEEILRIIREEEPPKPSTRISTLGDRTEIVAASRGGDAGQLRRSLRGDIDWIVMRAMEKDRNRRYESAASLADDIERFLRDDPVHACPPSAAYRARKFVRRYRRAVIAAAALLLVMVLGLVGTTYGLVRANDARRRAVGVNFRMAFERGLALCDEGNGGQGMLWLARALQLCPDDDPDMERVVRANLNAWRREMNALQAVFPHEAAVLSVAFSPDGRRLATGSEDHTARIWDVETGEPVGPPLEHPEGDVHNLVYTADGARLLSTDYSRNAYLWDARTGTLLRTLTHGTEDSPPVVAGATFRHPDDREVVTSCGDRTVAIWGPDDATPTYLPSDAHETMVHDVAVSPDGRRILTSSHDSTAKLWDFDTRELLATFRHDTEVVTADFRGNDQVVTGDANGNVVLWNIERALAAEDGILAISREEYLARWHHVGTVHRLRVSSDGELIASAGFDNAAHLWGAGGDARVVPVFEHQAAVWEVAMSPDGSRIATACDDNVARLWQPAAGQRVHTVHHERAFDHPAVYTRDGRYLLVKTGGVSWAVHDAVTKAQLCALRHSGGIRAFAVNPDRSRILIGGADGVCGVWDIGRDAAAFEPFTHGKGVWSVDISPDGSRTLTAGFGGLVQVRDIRNGAMLESIRVGSRVEGLAFGPDGKRFVVGCSAKLAQVFTADGDGPVLELKGHHGAVFSPSFSRDGTRIATGSHDNTARVWDAATGAPLVDPMDHPGPVSYLLGTAFSPDGKTLATVCDDRSVRVWDVATGRRVGPVLRHPSRVMMVAFASDTELRTGTTSGVVRVWDAERSAIRGDAERLRLWVQMITGFELDDGGALHALDDRTWKDRRTRLEALGGPPAQR